MHSITEHRDPPFIEITVFDRYPETYSDDIEAVIARYAMKYDEFCILEVQHGRIAGGLWMLFRSGGRVSEELLAGLKKVKRYAVVNDEPGLLMRFSVGMSRFGSMDMRLFKLHELDDARAWMRV